VERYTQGIGHVPAVVGDIEKDIGANEATVGTTVSIICDPMTEPEKWAGGAGSIEIGPASMR
jgi:hypothetical protein